MQKLKNKVTGEEYLITGAIGVPREIDENTFEVWMHFSVDLGEGRVDTIEVHPESTEYEVIDIPDPEPEPTPEPEPEPEPEPTPEPEPVPVISEPTPEELEAQAAMQARMEWFAKRQALDKMIDEMKQGREIGLDPKPEDLVFMQELGQWINDNRKQEYYF